MPSTSITTVVKMMETLPVPAQDKVAEYVRQFIQEIQDEFEWDALFKKTQNKFIDAARKAKKEIAAGKAKPMEYDRL